MRGELLYKYYFATSTIFIKKYPQKQFSSVYKYSAIAKTDVKIMRLHAILDLSKVSSQQQFSVVFLCLFFLSSLSLVFKFFSTKNLFFCSTFECVFLGLNKGSKLKNKNKRAQNER